MKGNIKIMKCKENENMEDVHTSSNHQFRLIILLSIESTVNNGLSPKTLEMWHCKR